MRAILIDREKTQDCPLLSTTPTTTPPPLFNCKRSKLVLVENRAEQCHSGPPRPHSFVALRVHTTRGRMILSFFRVQIRLSPLPILVQRTLHLLISPPQCSITVQKRLVPISSRSQSSSRIPSQTSENMGSGCKNQKFPSG